MLNQVLNLIFPPRCEVCKKDSLESLCQDCFGQIRFLKPQLGVHSVSVYDGVLKEAILRYKYNRRRKLAEPLGVLLVKYLSYSSFLNINELDALVPVPLHQKRLRQRGFNQAELLTQIISHYHGLPTRPVLERVRDTHAQFDLPRDERQRNVAGAFRVRDPQAVFAKRLLLVDDIYTTGATIAECTRALKIAGAKRVEVLTLSRAVEV